MGVGLFLGVNIVLNIGPKFRYAVFLVNNRGVDVDVGVDKEDYAILMPFKWAYRCAAQYPPAPSRKGRLVNGQMT